MISQQLKLTQTAVAVTAALVAGASSAVFAQEADVTTETVKVTASRVEQELKDVNMSVSVITAEQIEKSGAQTVGELLRDVPGVRINNDGSQGMKRIKIRGEDTFRTLVMIDGQKMSEHKSMSGSPMLIDPAMIERIEVIKGPASVLYGSDAIGGAINIITKKGAKKPFEAGVSAGIDGSNTGTNASAYIAGSVDGWNYRLGLAHEKGDELKTPAGDLDKTGFSSFGVNGYLAYDINENSTVGMTLDHFDMDFMSGSVQTGYDNFFVDVPEWKRDKIGVFGDFKNITEYLTRVRVDAFYQKSNKQMLNHVDVVGMPMIINNYADNDLDQYGFSVQTDWQLGES
ncbi:MAG: TonB-dependent receptor plug domain-containing protein, partial [Sutterellaceae bacterium]|nr:TonB-dependent receptor plug domain-containing protein [Sutterellaceae bacterium]